MVDSTKLPEVDINAIATDLNNKADRDLVNITVPYVVSRTANSHGGIIEIWSDGYCVQNGYTLSGNNTLTLEQSYKDTNFLTYASMSALSSTFEQGGYAQIGVGGVNKIYVRGYYNGSVTRDKVSWRTEGYIR